ncbi:MFS transporter [Actinopolyspora saharensis]|uniref:MFS transporter n=1 Tax=Actinopolyspora saharensis TaxID=995062 RepID=UPI003F675D04
MTTSSEQSTEKAEGTANPLVIATLCLAQLMLIVDMVVINVALPVVQADLNFSPADSQWVVSAYALTFGGLLVLSGRIGDMFGQRRLLLVGLVIFTAASAVCGLAQEGWQLFVARAFQGVGATLVSPNALSLLNLSASGETARNKGIAWWSVVGISGAALGQGVGGVVATLLSWRWIFLVNIPIGVVVILAVLRLLPAVRPTTRVRTDFGGAITLTASLTTVVFILSQVEHAQTAGSLILYGLVALVLLGAFAVIENRHPEPLIKLSLLAGRAVVTGNLVTLLTSAANMGILYFTSFYLQHVLGYEALAVGLAYVPVTLVMTFVAAKSAWLIKRFGVRPTLTVGTLMGAVSAFWLHYTPADGSYFGNVAAPLLLLGIGSALIEAPAIVVATKYVSESDQGLAAGLVNTSEQMGSALGLASIVTVATMMVPTPQDAGPALLVDQYHVGFLAGAVAFAVACAITFLAPKKTAASEDGASARPAADSSPVGDTTPDASVGETAAADTAAEDVGPPKA